MNDATPLAGKVALVTGSSRNIGRAIALQLARLGADIIVNARSEREAAESAAQEIRALGRRAVVCMADISDSDAVDAMVARGVEQMGGLNIVVMNAALRRQKPIAEISNDEWREITGVALDGAFYVSRATVPHLRAAGSGRMVFLGGSPSHMGAMGRSHVCAAKMGAVGLMRALATELGPDNITANTVAPGHIDTLRGQTAGVTTGTGANRPIERKGAPKEIAGTVAYLCSDAAAYTTGQTLHVNGGMFYG